MILVDHPLSSRAQTAECLAVTPALRIYDRDIRTTSSRKVNHV
jgi:hypothetical protein